jgi:Glycosyltransferase family 17
MKKIYETIIFYNELDMLELHLSITADHVDRIIITESSKTFMGVDKPWNLENNWARFAKWHDKIEYIKWNAPTFPSPWEHEAHQRLQANEYLGRILQDDDVVIIVDVDEILRPEAIQYTRDNNLDFYAFKTPTFYFKYNYMCTNDQYKAIPKAFIGHIVRDTHKWGHKINDLRVFDWWHINWNDIPAVKNFIFLNHAGWHFSYIGDNDFIKNKIRNFSHQEYNLPEFIDDIDIDTHIEQGQDCLKRTSFKWAPVAFDDYFPVQLRDAKYQSYIIPNATASVQNFYNFEILSKG